LQKKNKALLAKHNCNLLYLKLWLRFLAVSQKHRRSPRTGSGPLLFVSVQARTSLAHFIWPWQRFSSHLQLPGYVIFLATSIWKSKLEFRLPSLTSLWKNVAEGTTFISMFTCRARVKECFSQVLACQGHMHNGKERLEFLL